jgi:hypothetical protein
MHTNIPYHILSKLRFRHHLLWSILMSCLIVAIAATIGRATLNLRGALTLEDPTLAVFMLRPDDGITDVTILRANQTAVDVLAETPTGPKWMQLKKGEHGQWFIVNETELRE